MKIKKIDDYLEIKGSNGYELLLSTLLLLTGIMTLSTMLISYYGIIEKLISLLCGLTFLTVAGLYFFSRPRITGKIIKLFHDGTVEFEDKKYSLIDHDGKKIIVLDKEKFDKLKGKENNIIFFPRRKSSIKQPILALILKDEDGKLTKVPLAISLVNTNAQKLIKFID